MRTLQKFKSALTRLRRLAGHDQSGVAVMEFAFVAPVMILMVLGTAETVRFVRAKLLFRTAITGMAEAIAAQYSVSSGSGAGTLSDFCKGTQLTMLPLSSTSLSAVIASVTNPLGKDAQRDWEMDTACPTTAKALGSSAAVSLGSPLVPSAGDSVLIVQASYTYTPMLKAIIPLPLSLSTTILLRPRSGAIACKSC